MSVGTMEEPFGVHVVGDDTSRFIVEDEVVLGRRAGVTTWLKFGYNLENL